MKEVFADEEVEMVYVAYNNEVDECVDWQMAGDVAYWLRKRSASSAFILVGSVRIGLGWASLGVGNLLHGFFFITVDVISMSDEKVF